MFASWTKQEEEDHAKRQAFCAKKNWQTEYVVEQFEVALEKAKEAKSDKIVIQLINDDMFSGTTMFMYQNYDNKQIDAARAIIESKGHKCLVDERDWSCWPIDLVFERKNE